MSRPFKITNLMARDMRALRELGVPVKRIARKFGVQADTVRRHTSDEDRDKILNGERARQARYAADPDFVEKKRAAAREYARKLRADIKAERNRRMEETAKRMSEIAGDRTRR